MNRIKSLLKKPKAWIASALLIAVLSSATVLTDEYFEISKNLEIFTSLYKELNIYYVDDTKPGTLMKTGIDAMLRSLDPYTVYFNEQDVVKFKIKRSKYIT